MTSESSFPLGFDLDQNRTPAQNRRAVRVFSGFSLAVQNSKHNTHFLLTHANTRLVSPLKSVFYIDVGTPGLRVGVRSIETRWAALRLETTIETD